MGNRVSEIGVAVLVCLLAIMAAVEIGGSDANKISLVLKYLTIASFMIGLFQPKGAFYWLILVSAYLNLVKRLTVFDGQLNFIELIVSNLAPPACVAGICIGTAFGFITKKYDIRASHVIGTVIAALLAGIVVIAKTRGGAGAVGGGLNGAVNAGCYLFLVPMVAIHHRSASDIAKLLKWVCWVCVPVAIYAVYQAFYGFAWWESLFETGMASSMIELEFGEIRAVSTLNSAISLSSVMAICAVLCIYLARSRDKNGVGFGIVTALVLFVIFSAGLAATMRRSGILLLVAAIIAVFMLRTRGRTLLFYGSGVAMLLSLYIFSGFLLKWTWDNRTLGQGSDSKFLNGMLQFSTWQDRIAGFNNMMTNPNLWEPFGVSKEYIRKTSYDRDQIIHGMAGATDFSAYRGESYTHDVFSNAIVSYGYVPMSFVLVFAVLVAFKLHSRLLSLPVRSVERFNLTWMLAISAGIMASGITSIQAISIFPVNVFAYTIFGFAWQLWMDGGERLPSRPGIQAEPPAIAGEALPA